MESDLNDFVDGVRIITVWITLFAVGSLVIAGIGQYAVIAFDMRRRTRDFGVRIALGASSQQILGSVIGQGLRWTGAGLAIGFALSLAAGMAFRSLLVGVTPTDLPTYLGVFTLLAIASLLACYLPARCRTHRSIQASGRVTSHTVKRFVLEVGEPAALPGTLACGRESITPPPAARPVSSCART